MKRYCYIPEYFSRCSTCSVEISVLSYAASVFRSSWQLLHRETLLYKKQGLVRFGVSNLSPLTGRRVGPSNQTFCIHLGLEYDKVKERCYDFRENYRRKSRHYKPTDSLPVALFRCAVVFDLQLSVDHQSPILNHLDVVRLQQTTIYTSDTHCHWAYKIKVSK